MVAGGRRGVEAPSRGSPARPRRAHAPEARPLRPPPPLPPPPPPLPSSSRGAPSCARPPRHTSLPGHSRAARGTTRRRRRRWCARGESHLRAGASRGSSGSHSGLIREVTWRAKRVTQPLLARGSHGGHMEIAPVSGVTGGQTEIAPVSGMTSTLVLRPSSSSPAIRGASRSHQGANPGVIIKRWLARRSSSSLHSRGWKGGWPCQ